MGEKIGPGQRRPYFNERHLKMEGAAARRRERMEKEGELSLSHWRGDLHAHHQQETGVLPHEIAAERGGSNCGAIPADVLAEHQLNVLGHLYLGFTDHSRDPADFSDTIIHGVAKWFYGLYLNNDHWLQEKFKKRKDELTQEEIDTIRNSAIASAKELIQYNDQRLRGNLERVNDLSKIFGDSVKLFKGVEVNLLQDGNLDTPMVERGGFELVNVSFHPRIERNKEGNIIGPDAEIVKDPQALTNLMVKGIRQPKTNIICHIGYNIPDHEVVQQLDWEQIAREAAAHQVAIEINLQDVMNYLYQEILDVSKYPADEVEYRKVLKRALPRLVPLLSDPVIADKLKPFFSKGLKISINTDLHKLPYAVKEKDSSDKVEYRINPKEIRYWRALKIVEQYFNELFKTLGVKRSDIINTYSIEELKNFLKKERTNLE